MVFRVRSLTALLIIFLGVVLILENFGVELFKTSSIWTVILPLIILFLGIHIVFNHLKRGYGGWMFGSFLIIFGTLLLLNVFNVIQFEYRDVLKLWPLFIIYVGFLIIRPPSSRRRTRITTTKNDKTYKQKYNWKNYSIGDHEFKEPNWKVEPMDLNGLAGDYYLDFTKAFIPEEEIPITIRSLAGDVRILVPESIAFRVEAVVKAGDIDIVGNTREGINQQLIHETPAYESATKKLDLCIDLKAGSIRIDSV